MIRKFLPSLALAALLAVSVRAEHTGPSHRVLAADDSTRRLAIIAPDGSVEWEMKVGAIHDAWVLPNGNILYQQGWTKIVEVTPEKQPVWEYDAAKMNGNEGKRVEVHAFQRLDHGLTMIAESGTARIIEVDKAGKIQREVKLKVNIRTAQRHAARPQDRQRPLPRRARKRRLRARVRCGRQDRLGL
jgi:hypothetical protein